MVSIHFGGSAEGFGDERHAIKLNSIIFAMYTHALVPLFLQCTHMPSLNSAASDFALLPHRIWGHSCKTRTTCSVLLIVMVIVPKRVPGTRYHIYHKQYHQIPGMITTPEKLPTRGRLRATYELCFSNIDTNTLWILQLQIFQIVFLIPGIRDVYARFSSPHSACEIRAPTNSFISQLSFFSFANI